MTMKWLVITAPFSSMLSFKANIQALTAERTVLAEQVHVWEATLPVTAGIHPYVILFHCEAKSCIFVFKNRSNCGFRSIW